MNLIDTIRKTQNNIALNAIETNEQKRIKWEYQNKGVLGLNAYNFERRSISGFVSTQVEKGKTTPTSDLLNGITYYKNITSNIKVPYLKSDGVVWGNLNSQDNNIHCSSLYLAPKRISTYIDISNTIDTQNKDFNQYLENTLMQGLFDKMIETMFSDDVISEAPKGLFSLKASKQLNEMNLKDAVLNVTKNKYNGKFLLSPSAYIYLYTNNKDLFDNGKLMGFDYIVDGRIKDKFATFIDVTKIAVADYTLMSVTNDKVTKLKEGFIRMICDSYFDFGLLDNDAMEVLKVA